jgi:hypothetical protein
MLAFVYSKYGHGSKGYRRYGDSAASAESDIGEKPMTPSISLFLGLGGPEVYHHSFQSYDTTISKVTCEFTTPQAAQIIKTSLRSVLSNSI